MRRYEMQIIVRPREPTYEDWRSDRLYRVRITAASELAARRRALEHAWKTGYLVSGVLDVSVIREEE